jgi:hypothetical protein
MVAERFSCGIEISSGAKLAITVLRQLEKKTVDSTNLFRGSAKFEAVAENVKSIRKLDPLNSLIGVVGNSRAIRIGTDYCERLIIAWSQI